ncbi:alpha/beta hydrolase [Nocardioides sp. 503]|uniref:alpha/beta fold hydrolase n=1 Tax=Nocardioides sp. 503 TaxID=2508326 RepID=UPI0010703DEB|nr:alpha/beta hydrolase [Nocardioides sp. 503]
MTDTLTIDSFTLAYDVTGEGPLVVLAHGMGDSRHSYRFLVPLLVQAGYRVANLDIRGSGDSSLGWDDYSRTAMGGDLVALVRHLGGPAVIIGQSISGGAATVAAATAPELVVGLIELAPFTRAQKIPLGAMFTNPRFRKGSLRLLGTMIFGRLSSWKKYLDLAIPVKPADWDAELARIDAKLSEPGRMKALQAMTKTDPADAGAMLSKVACPVLVVQGSVDPDWADPVAEGEKVVADLPDGLGELVVLEGVGHYPHTQSPDEVLALAVPFLTKAFATS